MRIVMVKAKYCTKCTEMVPMMKDVCTTMGVGLEILDVDTPEGKELVTELSKEFELTKVPVLVFYDDYNQRYKVNDGPMSHREIVTTLENCRKGSGIDG